MIVRDSFKIAGAAIAARLFAYYDAGPKGLFGEAPVSESGWLWWQTPVALQALLRYESLSQDYSNHYKIEESFRVNNDLDHGIFSPSWGGIENDEKNDDMLWWTLAALQTNDSALLESAARSYDHVRRFWAGQEHASCFGGGIRWSADPSHPGWSYLNSVTNGQFFLSSAILMTKNIPNKMPSHSQPASNVRIGTQSLFEDNAQFTSQQYQEWAVRAYEWMKRASLISTDFAVYDGIAEPSCDTDAVTETDEWSYNIALLYLGTAYMYSHLGDASWLAEHESLKQHVLARFIDIENRLYEPTCLKDGCNGNDYQIFLAILARCMAQSYQLIPDERIRSILLSTADAAMRECGQDSQWTCHGGSSSRHYTHQRHLSSIAAIQHQVVALEVISAAQMVL